MPIPEILPTSEDLSPLISKIDVLLQIHGYTSKHQRVQAYFKRCGIPSRVWLTKAQMLNLIAKLEAMPVDSKEAKSA